MRYLFDEISDLKEKIKNKMEAEHEYDISTSTLIIDTDLKSKEEKVDKGNYYMVNSPLLHEGNKKIFDYTASLVKKYFKLLLKKHGYKHGDSILIVGIGNGSLFADALGPMAVRKVFVSGGLNLDEFAKLYAISPNVFSETGIETSSIVSALASTVKAKLVVIVDSLVTASIDRLSKSFQISDGGIIAGGGLESGNEKINESLLKVPCLVIGVPLMIKYSSINENKKNDIVLTPKDADEYVKRCASVVAKVINNSFNPTLSEIEIKELKFQI